MPISEGQSTKLRLVTPSKVIFLVVPSAWGSIVLLGVVVMLQTLLAPASRLMSGPQPVPLWHCASGKIS